MLGPPVIILATVAIYVCVESAENTPNMNIKLFYLYKKNFHSVSGSVSLPDGTILKYESKLTCCNRKVCFFSRQQIMVH